MTAIRKLLKTPGVTNAHVRLTNWVVLGIIVVELLLLLFTGDLRSTRSRIGGVTGTYFVFLLLAPTVFRWFDPGLPAEREGPWLVGVAASGGVALTLMFWTLAPLFD